MRFWRSIILVAKPSHEVIIAQSLLESSEASGQVSPIGRRLLIRPGEDGLKKQEWKLRAIAIRRIITAISAGYSLL